MNLRITRGRTYRFQTWTAFIDVRFLSLCSVFPSAYDTILGFFNPVKQSNGNSYPYPSHFSSQLKYVQQRSRVRSFSPLAWKNSRNTLLKICQGTKVRGGSRAWVFNPKSWRRLEPSSELAQSSTSFTVTDLVPTRPIHSLVG